MKEPDDQQEPEPAPSLGTPEKKKLSLKSRLLVSGAAVALVAVAAIGIGVSFANSGQAPEKASVATSAPATSGASATPKPEAGKVDVTKIPKSVVELGSFETLSPAEQAQIKEWDAMDIDSFRETPLADQQTFALFVYENNLGITKYRLDQTGRSDLYANIDTSTPQGATNLQNLVFGVLSSLVEHHSDGLFVNNLTQHKMVSLISNDLQGTTRLDQEIDTWSVNTQVVDNAVTVLDSKANADGSMHVDFRDEKTGNSSAFTYDLQPVKSITGETVQIPITVAVNQ